jgi:hypothetical protein
MSLIGIEPGGFGIKHDLAHGALSVAAARGRLIHLLIRLGILATAARIARTSARAAS